MSKLFACPVTMLTTRTAILWIKAADRDSAADAAKAHAENHDVNARFLLKGRDYDCASMDCRQVVDPSREVDAEVSHD